MYQCVNIYSVNTVIIWICGTVFDLSSQEAYIFNVFQLMRAIFEKSKNIVVQIALNKSINT